MKKYILAVFLFFSCSSLVYGDWNSSFDEETFRMCQELTGIDTTLYQSQYEVFMKLRQKYLKDAFLKKQVAFIKNSEKENFLKEKDGIIIKKRKTNNINEAFAWEFSTLFGSDSCIVPSFPMEIGGKLVVMQQMELFHIGDQGNKPPKKKVLRKVSLDAYWKGHLQAYLLGIGDLVARNIGISTDGKIRFFDIERSFNYKNTPISHESGFSMGFTPHSLAWPQFEEPLDEITVLSLKHFIKSLDHIEENLSIYLSCRPFSLDVEGFFYRLEKIRNFPLERGVQFKDFYCFLFPRMGAGLSELTKIIRHITQKNMSYGEVLLFARKELGRLDLSRKEKREIQRWLTAYID